MNYLRNGTAVALALAALHGGAAFAADADDASRIEALSQQVDDLSAQVADLKRSTSDQYTDVQNQQAASVKTSIDNGRLSVSSADGNFTAAVRVLGQFDNVYYSQGGHAVSLPAANGPDLSSGSNFRRAQLGLQGKVFGDWSYYVNFDFGSSKGNEQQGRIQSAYTEFDGWAPFAVRIGAYPPPAGLEDGTSSSDTIFLERNSPADLARNIAGGDGRDAASLLYTGDRIFAALSYTGGKVADTSIYFDEQQALLGRLSGVLLSDSDGKLVVSASGTWVLKAPDATAGPTSARNITLSDPLELTADDNGITLVSTGALNAQNVRQWAAESGGNWQNFYGQAGYFGYGIDRRQSALPDLDFNGWYAQASWVITGESRGYSKATGAFTAPKPDHPFDFSDGGWGAWELAARYSDLDLNDREGVLGHATPTGGIRGGEQKIWTLGVNWYPNSVIRFALNYENIDVNRLGSTGANVGQKIQAIGLRSQISL